MKNHKLSISILIAIGVVLGGFSGVQSKVSINITQDQYVLPVAELASTKTNPDIIHIDNNLVSIEIIPNRGRVLSSYGLSSSQQSFLYQKHVPDPMVLPGGLHTVEFGGYYLSLPWNTRDRQPFDLTFEGSQSTESLGEVYLSGKDMFQKTLTEVWIRLKDANPIVEIVTKITNTSKKNPKDLDFRDFVVFSVNNAMESNDQILLPVEKIKLIDSKDNWAGVKERVLEWPAPLSQWKSINQYLSFGSESPLLFPFGGVYYPETKTAFIKFWTPDDFFTGAEIWSWGKEYQKEPGAAPYVVYSNTTRFTLPPQKSKSFTTYFTLLNELSEQDLSPEAIQQKLSDLFK